MFKEATILVLVLQSPGCVFAQAVSQGVQWPDNIIVTKRLLGEGRVDENQMSLAESGAVAVCAQLGKLYEPGTLRKMVGEGAVVTGETVYLSGRKRMVITESLMIADEKEQTCIGRYRLGWTYDYNDGRTAWTVVRSPRGVYSPSRPQKDSPGVVQMLDRAYQNRLRKFQGEWQSQKYSEVETRFGHRCGYPPNPSELPRPGGMGEYQALYDRVVAAAQGFHSAGPKLCSLIASPQHVGTGEKLIIHFKDPQRKFDDTTGCYSLSESGGFVRKRCIPIVVDFKVDSAMPVGIFEKPDWAIGARPMPEGVNPPVQDGTMGIGSIERKIE